MANPTWPVGLPQDFLVAGFKYPEAKNRDETQMDAGKPFTRRKSTSVPRELTGAVRMTRTQYTGDFLTFYRTTLKEGTLDFDWIDPITQASTTMRFRDPPPDPRPAASGEVWDVLCNFWVFG